MGVGALGNKNYLSLSFRHGCIFKRGIVPQQINNNNNNPENINKKTRKMFPFICRNKKQDACWWWWFLDWWDSNCSASQDHLTHNNNAQSLQASRTHGLPYSSQRLVVPIRTSAGPSNQVLSPVGIEPAFFCMSLLLYPLDYGRPRTCLKKSIMHLLFLIWLGKSAPHMSPFSTIKLSYILMYNV